MHLQDIERAAGEPFRQLGMGSVADEAPPTVAVLDEFVQCGRAWVCTDDDRVIAYLLIELVDGDAHVEQVSVHPACARRRLGSALLEVAAEWGRRNGLTALSLTTYAEVPWNAPYYRRLGFRVVPEDQWGPGIRAVRDSETARGLDRWPRVVMARPLGCTTGTAR